MSSFVFATVIIKAEDQSQAISDIGDNVFITPLSPTGQLPATNYMSTGAFASPDLEKICNVVTWPKKIYFGTDYLPALEAENLKLIPQLQ